MNWTLGRLSYGNILLRNGLNFIELLCSGDVALDVCGVTCVPLSVLRDFVNACEASACDALQAGLRALCRGGS